MLQCFFFLNDDTTASYFSIIFCELSVPSKAKAGITKSHRTQSSKCLTYLEHSNKN